MVNFFAPLAGKRGYPVLARGLVHAMHNLGEPINLVSNDGYGNPIDSDLIELTKNAADLDDVSVNLAVAHPRMMAFFGGRRRIGYTLNETTAISERAVRTLNAMDAVWTTSTFSMWNFRGCGVARDIAVVPGGVDPEVFKRRKDARIEEVDGYFTFLAVGKFEPRKGYDILLETFLNEFDGMQAALILACHNPHIAGFNVFQNLFAAGITKRDHPKILVARSDMTNEEMAALYSCADAFVLPTRGEGWCLPAMEAMACGTPPIITDCSSIRDFLHEGIGFPVKVERMVPANDAMWSEFLVGEWAEPNAEHLRAQMRYAYDNSDEARRRGMAAAQEIREKWTWEHAARKAIRELGRWK